MSNEQLYILVGIPVLFNAAISGLILAHSNAKFEAVYTKLDALSQRIDHMQEMWRSELRRVEEVLDARLKHLEER